MPETNTQQSQPAAAGRRKEVVGEVVSNRMKKTIVVEVVRKKSHAFYGRVVSKAKKFYAHDEKNEAKVRRCGAAGRDPASVQAEALAAQADCSQDRADARANRAS